MLVIGMRGLGAEVCKNLVLAGVQALTVLDSTPLGPEDVAGRFLTQTDGENVNFTTEVSGTKPNPDSVFASK